MGSLAYLSSVTMVQRLTYRRRHCYATKSNTVRKVKTPGGVLTLHNVQKRGKGVKCGDCGKVLQGMPALVRLTSSALPRTRSPSLVRTVDPVAQDVCARGLSVLSLRSRRLLSRCLSRRRRTPKF